MNKKLKISIVAMAMVFVLLVGNILAYFTDADTATNEFTTGRISIDLQEPNWDPSLGGELTPGYELAKDPQVLNDGINDAYIFVTVDIPYQNVTTTDGEGNKLAPTDTELFSYDVKDGWMQVGEPIVDEENRVVRYVYAYAENDQMTALEPNVTTPTVFDFIRFEGVVEDEGLEDLNLEVIINAYGIQTDNLDGGKTTPEDVWQIVSNAKGSESNTSEEETKEYEIYFDEPYSFIVGDSKETFIFHEDGTADVYGDGIYLETTPYIYDKGMITIIEVAGSVSLDGESITFEFEGEKLIFTLEDKMECDNLQFGKAYTYSQPTPTALLSVSVENIYDVDTFIWHENGYTEMYCDGMFVGKGLSIYSGNEITVMGETGTVSSDGTGVTFGYRTYSLNEDFIYIEDEYYVYHDDRDYSGGWRVEAKDKTLTSYGEIPSEVNGIPVTNLSYCFRDCENLTISPKIPENVKDMESTFDGCTLLANAPEIPDSVTNMDSTFSDCTSLIEAPEIPDGVTSMSCTFYNCVSLANAPEIPDGVINMNRTFSDCTSLVNAPEIPDSVTIVYGAFSGCTSLIEAPEIPDGVTSMEYTFYGCKSLIEAPEIPDSVEDIDYTFYDCTSLINAPEIPDNVGPTIRETFANCTSIVTAPTIPDGVQELAGTFSGCTSLVNAPKIPNTVRFLTSTFSGCTSLVNSPTIPSSVNYMTGVFSGCTSLTGNVEINSSKVNSYSNCFKDTVKPIKITGSCSNTIKSNLAATANNGNVTY